MKMKYKTMIFTNVIIYLMIFAPVSGTNTFQYALTQSDITQSGFTLNTNDGNNITSEQTWYTPSDIYGSTTLNVTLANKTYINNLWAGFSLFGFKTVSFKGADKAYNISILGSEYYASSGNYILFIYSLFSNYSELKLLLEAQLAKLPSTHKSTPGFDFSIVLLSFGALALILTKKRKFY